MAIATMMIGGTNIPRMLIWAMQLCKEFLLRDDGKLNFTHINSPNYTLTEQSGDSSNEEERMLPQVWLLETATNNPMGCFGVKPKGTIPVLHLTSPLICGLCSNTYQTKKNG